MGECNFSLATDGQRGVNAKYSKPFLSILDLNNPQCSSICQSVTTGSGWVPITYIWLAEADDKYTYLAYIMLLIRIDNLKALLHNLPGNQLKRPRLVMNNAACLWWGWENCVISLLSSLSYTGCQIECRIKYKIFLLFAQPAEGWLEL